MNRLRAKALLVVLVTVLLTTCVAGCARDAVSADEAGAADAPADTAGLAVASEPAAESAAEEAPKKPRRERSTSVKTAPVVRRDLILPVHAEGSVRARHTSALTFEVAGRVTKIWVREGQRVKKGQTLVSLDDRELRLSLEEARARYLQGLGRLAVEEDGFASSAGEERVLDERRLALAERERQGELTREERLDQELEVGMVAVRKGAYRRELIEVRSGVAGARMDQARIEIELERTVVRAPFSGVISGLELNAGEHVQVGQTVARLVDDINLEAAVGVLESDLAKVAVGKKALLEIPALAFAIPVTVNVIDPEVAADSRT